MTTIKSILGWLFGVYRDSFALQLMLLVFICVHVGVAIVAYTVWLILLAQRLIA